MSKPTASLEETGAFRAKRPAGFARIFDSIVHVGRELLSRTQQSGPADGLPETLCRQCEDLINHRGEASGLALASEILEGYVSLSDADRLAFFRALAAKFRPDREKILAAVDGYRDKPDFDSLAVLTKAVEPPRQCLLRLLNMVPGGTAALVAMRGQLQAHLRQNPELRPLESDLRHLLISWFNRGFLVMNRIDWNSPASVLEKIVAYEAVHEINGLDDLRTRLAEDRRCFAFFHPAMPDDPLILLQVALTDGIVNAVEPLIDGERKTASVQETNTAVFYSISNCHDGLRGISFGNFLIKQVIEEVRRDLENIKRFVTLSPVPGFCEWVNETPIQQLPDDVARQVSAARELLASLESTTIADESKDARAILLRLCAYYLLDAKVDCQPMDPVARFHLSNGASLDRLNWKADCSSRGLRLSAGIMVNYAYRRKNIEKNHEAYFAEGKVVASAEVRKLAQTG